MICFKDIRELRAAGDFAVISGFSGRRSDFRSFRLFDRSSCLPIVPGSVVDRDQDPYEFRPPGSRSVIICTDPDPSFIERKKSKENLDYYGYCFVTYIAED